MDPTSSSHDPARRDEHASGPENASGAEPGCAGAYTARDARNQRRFLIWTLAAALAYLGATAALRRRESIPRELSWLMVGISWLVALEATRRFLVFLRQADELRRKIEIEGLALGFGAGVLFSLLYPLIEQLGAPHLDGNATAVVMMLSWSAGSLLGSRRYSGSGAG